MSSPTSKVELESAPRQVLVLAARAADGLACAGVLDAHRKRGDRVRVVVFCGSADSSALRELLEGARALGVEDVRALGFVEGSLGARVDLCVAVKREIDEFAPQGIAVPSPLHPLADQRALAAACAAALALRDGPQLMLYRELPLASPDGIERAAGGALLESLRRRVPRDDPFAATAVISTWNKRQDVCANLDALRAQTRPFSDIVVVDNGSKDGTAQHIREHYPEVRLVVMPHSLYGACETFNIGFSSAVTPLIAILDDDVVLPPHWLEKTVERLRREPPTTAIVSGEVEEPGMPPGYLERPELLRERYMSTFRGCASLARSVALREAGYYDERLFIYGNERDLTCRLLNLGYRVLQYPEVRAFHKTPFGIKMGKRSLYYHARNAFLTQLKYAPLGSLARLPFLAVGKVLLRGERKEREGAVSDATGTIGIGKSVRETPGATWVLVRAAFSVLANLPYCWKHRRPVRSPDYSLPLD
ncbi:MAG: glycosyltransferase [Planctomycetes bacterium]|nr:glycosyltransferase [Planctomycetota bacterium]